MRVLVYEAAVAEELLQLLGLFVAVMENVTADPPVCIALAATFHWSSEARRAT